MDNKHWIYVFSELSAKEKRFLKKYYSSLYPRGYVRKLVAILDNADVQLKESYNYGRFRAAS